MKRPPVIGAKDSFIRRALSTGKYDVLADGTVFNRDVRGTGGAAPLVQRIDHSGYVVVHLCDGARRQPVLLHRIVAIVHLPPQKPEQTQVNHVDGRKLNCAAENLEWCTQSENMRHAYRLGLRKPTVPESCKFRRGQAHPGNKLSEKDVAAMQSTYASESISQRELALRYGVTQSTVSRALKRTPAATEARQ